MYRQNGLDLARLMAAYLVLFGHFIFGGTFGTDSVTRQWVSKDEALPLLSKTGQSAWNFDLYLLEHWQTATAIWGVALFFLISGWIVPPMLSRYSRSQFLLNRVLRIFPMLIVAVIVAAAIQYCFGDRSSLRLVDIISTASLTNQFTGNSMSLGVIWSLIVEFKFYLLLAVLGRVSYPKIIWTLGALLLFSITHLILVKQGWYEGSANELSIVNFMIHDFHYIIFMFLGAALWLLLEKNKPSGTRLKGIIVFVLILLLFNAYRYGMTTLLGVRPFQDINLATQSIVFILFGFCLLVQHFVSGKGFVNHCIAALSNITYSLYLLHVSIGYFFLSLLRHVIADHYLLLTTVTVAVSVISAASYRLVEFPANSFAKHLRSKSTKELAVQ
jgi:peptidoglycan/LPS O-acetylase OafA/YrhL